MQSVHLPSLAHATAGISTCMHPRFMSLGFSRSRQFSQLLQTLFLTHTHTHTHTHAACFCTCLPGNLPSCVSLSFYALLLILFAAHWTCIVQEPRTCNLRETFLLCHIMTPSYYMCAGGHHPAHCPDGGQPGTLGRDPPSGAVPCAGSCHYMEQLRDHEGPAQRRHTHACVTGAEVPSTMLGVRGPCLGPELFLSWHS